MDINAYLLDGIIEATTPPGETAAKAQFRRDGIMAMFSGYDPADTMEAMIACQCITLQFLLNAATRDANDTRLDHDTLTRTRAGAVSISKTLQQWVTKIEKIKLRKEARAAEALKAARANASPDMPVRADPPAAQPRAETRPPAAPPNVSPAADAPPLDRRPPNPDTNPPALRTPRELAAGEPGAAAVRSRVGEREAIPA